MKRFAFLWELFLIFFKIGAFTFGGGLVMLPMIQKEVVDRRKWVSEAEILDFFAITQSVPGVIAVNASIFIGNKIAGFPGAVVAALGVILPAFISILLVITLLTSINDNPITVRVLEGIRAATASLILLAAIKLGRGSIKDKVGVLISIMAFTMIVVFGIHAIWVIIFSAIVGFIGYLLKRRQSRD